MALGLIERKAVFTEISPLVVRTNGKLELSVEVFLEHLNLYSRHRDSVKGAYFNITKGNPERMFFQQDLGNGLTKKVGLLEAFTPEEMACFLKTAQDAYEKQGTMGNFPIKKTNLEAIDLTKEFIGGFRTRTAVVLIEKQNPGIRREVVGGLVIKAGSRKVPIGKLIGKPDSSISTLSALDFSVPEEINEILERNTFGASRLFSTAEEVDKAKVLRELVVGAEEARVCLENYLKRPLVLGIADIHDDRLLQFVSHFGWQLATDNTTPTQWIPPVLRYHYDHFSQGGRKIKVIMAERMTLRDITQKQLADSPEMQKLLYGNL